MYMITTMQSFVTGKKKISQFNSLQENKVEHGSNVAIMYLN